MWDLKAILSPRMRAKKPRNHAVLQMRGFLRGCPAILILGSSFRDDEPWRQILAQLDRPTTEQIKHFLGGLDAAAEAAGARALVCIDALNERDGLDIWPHRLAAFLKDAEGFPRIGIVLSCRSTYVPYAKVYLDKRGIVRPGAPNLVPEFENPLFLKTLCDFLEKDGKRELPRGLRGVTSSSNPLIFDRLEIV